MAFIIYCFHMVLATSSLTLGQYATAVGAPARWVQNAHAVLGLGTAYTPEGARRLAFARLLKETAGMPLVDAYPLAAPALASWPTKRSWTLSRGGAAAVTVDLERFLSDCSVRLSLARSWYVERRRGRPPKTRRRGVAWAKWYGVDVTLLVESLKRTPAERLRALDANLEFLKSVRLTGR
jgi:hypothetical protein